MANSSVCPVEAKSIRLFKEMSLNHSGKRRSFSDRGESPYHKLNK
jgi:hypothetical protein